jgi:hypothetical protein
MSGYCGLSHLRPPCSCSSVDRPTVMDVVLIAFGLVRVLAVIEFLDHVPMSGSPAGTRYNRAQHLGVAHTSSPPGARRTCGGTVAAHVVARGEGYASPGRDDCSNEGTDENSRPQSVDVDLREAAP